MSSRRIIATVAMSAFALLLTGPASYADESPQVVPSEAPNGHTVNKVVPRPSELTRSDSTLSTAPQRQMARAEAADVVELPGYCATGYRAGTLLNQQSFEQSLPYPSESYGFNRTTSGGAAHGSYNATSTVSAGNYVLTYVNSSHVALPAGARISVSFSYRGSTPQGSGGFSANNFAVSLNPATNWTRAAFDVTSETRTNGGFLDAYFFNDTTYDGLASSMRVDDVRVYTCVPTTYARGDWTGDGRTDLMGIQNSTGDHYLYTGKGNGKFGSAAQVGSGWNGFEWAGSPGDVNNDSLNDVLGLRTDGELFLYAGRGNSKFLSARHIASLEAGDSLATPGDMDGDGLIDLLLRDADGTLTRYSFDTYGNLLTDDNDNLVGTTIGWGWGGMRFIIGMGDLNKDGRGDILGVSGVDNCIYAYTAKSDGGLNAGRKLGCGWGAMTYLASPGDTDRDGFGDLVARRSDGTLWSYRGKSGGGAYPGVKIGSGWQHMRIIF